MKLFRITLASLIVLVLIGTTVMQANWFSGDEPEAIKPIDNEPFTFSTFRQIAKKESDAVVNIATTTIVKPRAQRNPHNFGSPFEDFFGDDMFRHFFGPQTRTQRVQSLGSGVIIDEEGYILTNNHVISQVDEIQVNTLDGETYDAEIVGTDEQTDIALIKIKPNSKLKAIKLGDSEILEVGDWVMAIGNPFGFGHTVTVGVVSAKGRSLFDLRAELPYQDFIQTDASINPGNSGGPLLDIYGRLVGINTVIASRTGQSAGIGFSIPVNMIKSLLHDLKETGSVTRGWLGVTIQSIDKDLKEAFDLDTNKGALVSEVVEDGPAEKAGLQTGDIITNFNGVEIKDSNHLSMTVASTSVNAKVKVKVLRKGKTKSISVVLGKRPGEIDKMSGRSGISEDFGMTVQNITPEIARQLRLEDIEGVLISDVAPDGAAADAGLRPRDVILEVNQTAVKSVSDYSEVIKDIEKGQSVIFYILRGQSRIFVALKIG